MEITDIKQRLTITEVLAHYQFTPTAKGSMKCPFHESKPNSRKKTLQIYTDTNRYQCFHNDCTAGNGDVIDFIEKMEGFDKLTPQQAKHEAIKKAKSMLSVSEIPQGGKAIEKTKTLIIGSNPITSDASRSGGTGYSDIQDAHSDVTLRSVAKGGASGNQSLGQVPTAGTLTTTNPSYANRISPKALAVAQLRTENPYKLTYKTTIANYAIMGGLKKELDSMRVTLVIAKLTSAKASVSKSRSKLDLYEDKQVEKTARESGEKLDLRPDLVEADLNRLTDLLEEYRDTQREDETPSTPKIMLTADRQKEVLQFLSQPELIKRLNDLIGKSGVIGEDNNRIFLFGIASSYKMPNTLHALIQGSSGSGKTHLLSKISNYIPEEDKKHFTRVTEGSFYNYGLYDLQNKLICLEDLDGMKEDAYLAFRELQSRGMISSSTSGKDEDGNIRAFEKIVHGPIASMSCTTKGEVYEDNMNRCFLIAVDETHAQTQRIIKYQNQKASGGISEHQEQEATNLIKDCVRMLKPHKVVNPYANQVNLPEEAHKIRRLNDQYQSYVKQIALLNQYRRTKDNKGRLVCEKEDLQVAADIMFDSIVLKIDELDGSMRLFYERLKEYVTSKGDHPENYTFGQREIRQALNISKTQLHRYIHDLTELEYIRQTGGHANRGYTYKILYWDNITQLRAKVKRHLQGQLDQLEMYKTKEMKDQTKPAFRTNGTPVGTPENKLQAFNRQ